MLKLFAFKLLQLIVARATTTVSARLYALSIRFATFIEMTKTASRTAAQALISIQRSLVFVSMEQVNLAHSIATEELFLFRLLAQI